MGGARRAIARLHRILDLALILPVVVLCAFSMQARAGVYPMIQASFDLPNLLGNPFDFTTNDVRVVFRQPDGKPITLPAFFDGGQTWRVRHTPDQAGKCTVSEVTLNGHDAHPLNLSASEFNVGSSTAPGFIAIDPQHRMRFIDSSGDPYYPVGCDLAWHGTDASEMVGSLDKMGAAGINWTRIWMCHWDGANLDWPEDPSRRLPPGELDLAVARRWDGIINAADRNQIRFQMVLQHHGQYSTGADPNWQRNPWNKSNGGWLGTPDQFFTDPRAIALTRAKYRYIIARWGYSPSIMAWELFNEFEFTDAYKLHKFDDIARWHEAMAQFIREQDIYHHLITTSSNVADASVWRLMDYYDAHAYAPDVLSAMAALDAKKLTKPYFYGELGPLSDPDPASGAALHRILWGSLMSDSSGAAQYWFWDVVEANNLWFHFTAARRFIDQSHYALQQGLKPIEVEIRTPHLAPLTFAAGMNWAPATKNEYTVDANGSVEGIGGMSAYLQGNGTNKSMAPYMLFNVNFPQEGTFSVNIDLFSGRSARIEAKLDGKPVTNLELQPPLSQVRKSPDAKDRKTDINATLEIMVPAGAHSIHLENTGADWARIERFTLSPYAPELAVVAKGGPSFVALWAEKRPSEREGPVVGILGIGGLAPGHWEVVWFDTRAGRVIDKASIAVGNDGIARIQTPPIGADAAAWLHRL